MEFSENIVLGGSKKEYCKYSPATGILCWVSDVLGDFYLTRLSGLMGSKADSRAGDLCLFPRREDPLFSYCEASLKKQGGDTEELILFSGWLGVFYLPAVGCQWHGAKFCMAS